MILLKNDEVIDFLTWPPTDFSALKCSSWKCYLIFKNRLPGYCRWQDWRHSDRKRICFTDEKNFYLSPPVSYQYDRVWAHGKKTNVKQSRLLVEREKFAKQVMVSAGVCLGCKGPLHFVEKKAKVDCRITLATCFQISSKTAIACCPPDSSSSQHTHHAAHRTGCWPTVQISSQRTSGLQIRRI